jgi:hypothetical protein
MNVILLLVFVGLCLLGGTILALAWSVKVGDPEHADRLALLPLEAPVRPVLRTPPELGHSED